MNSTIIKKAGQDEQQNLKVITTNINNIQNLMSLLKKTYNKDKIASGKNKTKKSDSLEKIREHYIIRPGCN